MRNLLLDAIFITDLFKLFTNILTSMWSSEPVTDCSFRFSLSVSSQCAVTPKKLLIFQSDQMSTVTDTVSMLASSAFNLSFLCITRSLSFEVMVRLQTGVYLLSIIDKKLWKFLLLIIDNGRLQFMIRSDSVECSYGFLLRMTTAIEWNSAPVNELQDLGLSWSTSVLALRYSSNLKEKNSTH